MNLAGLSVKGFLDTLAGDSPTPGGGSVSALAGSLGAALCAMVARLTLGREKHRGAWQEMERLRDTADFISSRLLDLVDKDAEAYNGVMAAFQIPKEDAKTREAAVQSAVKAAASVPLETLRTVAGLVELVEASLARGNPNCLTDAGVAAQLIRAAAKGAAYNVRINLPGILDREFASQLASETFELEGRIEGSVREIESAVQERLK